MALEQHNTAFEFETMLRRHLSRGGSMVEACAGFDADSASAYLENVLGQVARSRYESHLGGCPSCRRHVIELSRLLQLPQVIPQAETQTIPIAKPETTWSKWKTAAAGCFDFPAWNRGWATAGAAAAVLLAVMATQLWRQNSPAENAVALSSPGANPAGSLESNAQPQVPGVTDSLLAGGGIPQQTPTLLHPGAVPTPDVTPPVAGSSPFSLSLDAQQKGIETSTALSSFGPISPQAPILPAPATTAGRVMTAGFAPNLTNGQPSISFDAAPAPPAPETAEAVAVADTAKIIAPLSPSPSDNPMTRIRKPNPTPTPKTLGSFSFLPSGKAETERKAEIKEIEEGAPRLLTIRVRDKIFSFQGGMWVDHAYKPDMAWRVIKLVRDSEEYKQALAAEPQLKEFFDRSAVIVVWKDKIYKVVPK